MLLERENQASKSRILILLIGLGLFLFSTAATAQDSYRIGGTIPLTGKVASFGAYTFRGVEMAMNDLAQKGWIGGKKIEIQWEDNEYEPRKAIAAFNKLAFMDKVNFIIITGSPIVRALVPLAEQNKVVQCYTSASNDKVRTSGNYTFKMMGGQVTESLAMAKFARENLKAKKVALITNDSEYGVAGADLFELYFKKMGGEIVARESVRPGEREYSSVLIRANAKTPEVIAIIQTSVDAGYTVKQAKRLGIKAKLLGATALYSSETITTAGPDAEGLFAVAYQFEPKTGTPAMRAFGEKYKNKYEGFPPIYSAAAYDAIMLYAEAVKAGAKTSEEIKNFFRGVKNYEGVAGTLTFDSHSEASASHRVLEVKGGDFKVVHEFKKFSETEM
jgi:branched-chain amino acid transport system substrate-binding protein